MALPCIHVAGPPSRTNRPEHAPPPPPPHRPQRAAVSPSNVRKLVNEGVRVIVQPSNLRVFPDAEYTKVRAAVAAVDDAPPHGRVQAGAIVQEDLSPASTVLGVKEVPIAKLLPGRTYVFFSHTIKAQEYNMPLLDAILERNIRLIDYEKMLDEEGQRVVAFGDFAGRAGMIDLFHGLGNRMLGLGYYTPFVVCAAWIGRGAAGQLTPALACPGVCGAAAHWPCAQLRVHGRCAGRGQCRRAPHQPLRHTGRVHAAGLCLHRRRQRVAGTRVSCAGRTGAG